MKAEYTVKINGVFYKAGEEIPETREKKEEVKAVATEPMVAVEPPVSFEEKEEQPREKRKYTRRK